VCRAIIDFARENLDFPRLNALTDARNTASIALLDALGFSYMEDTTVSGSRTRRYEYPLKLK
jgi:RimJ/RimL family protein N-acetyltransferase